MFKFLMMKSAGLIRLILPLLLIPLTLYAVLNFGHEAGNLIIGAAFLIGLLKFTENQNEKRFIIVLAIFAILFETANVALGLYKYLNVIQVPVWIGLGWGVLGIYLLRNKELLDQIKDNAAYAFTILVYLGVLVWSGVQVTNLIPVLFGIAAVYVLRLSSKFPASFYALASFMGILIEFSGTTVGIWTYFTETGSIMPPPLAYLGMAYASVIAFALWISRLE
ncbi:hypothetical protein HYT84_01465 [Candidatus Micrarchaeota archaeon]|nr:hypothetical protein [Candidatus Micrarchaeota archaeon]